MGDYATEIDKETRARSDPRATPRALQGVTPH